MLPRYHVKSRFIVESMQYPGRCIGVSFFSPNLALFCRWCDSNFKFDAHMMSTRFKGGCWVSQASDKRLERQGACVKSINAVVVNK